MLFAENFRSHEGHVPSAESVPFVKVKVAALFGIFFLHPPQTIVTDIYLRRRFPRWGKAFLPGEATGR